MSAPNSPLDYPAQWRLRGGLRRTVPEPGRWYTLNGLSDGAYAQAGARARTCGATRYPRPAAGIACVAGDQCGTSRVQPSGVVQSSEGSARRARRPDPSADEQTGPTPRRPRCGRVGSELPVSVADKAGAPDELATSPALDAVDYLGLISIPMSRRSSSRPAGRLAYRLWIRWFPALRR